MEYKLISLQIENKVAILTLSNPDAMNAICLSMMNEVSDAVREVTRPERGVRCLFITGEGAAFCSGANMSDDDVSTQNMSSGEILRQSFYPTLYALKNMPIPMVSAVNGVAAGVGCSLALMGDMVCASSNAYFLQAFVRIGLVPDTGSTFLLPRLIGWGRAAEMTLLGEKITADKALEWGLINRLYDDQETLMTEAMAIANKLASGPKSIGLTRQALWESASNSYEEQLEIEARLQDEAFFSEDFAEGKAAFLGKRAPKYSGR